MRLVPVACRFVPYDQWFVTHLDDDAKVRQVKLWFLAKCNLVHARAPLVRRPVSPITFAPSVRSRPSLDSLDDGYNEDDESDELDDDDLPPPRRPTPRHAPDPPAQASSDPLVQQYTLLSFSTGTILEDDFALSWYNLRPYELLEIHPVGMLAPLRRDVLAEYVQPYFQARVRVLPAVWNTRSGRFEGPGVDDKPKDRLAHRLDTLSPKPGASEKKRKTKADWKPRWVVINHGLFSLCKDHPTGPPLFQFPLSTMSALRGADALERALSIAAQPRVVCIQFRPRSTGVVSPPPSLPSSPIVEDPKSNFPITDPSSEQEQTAGEYSLDTIDAFSEGGEWIVLDMLDDHAFSSILRILHRQAPNPISSSFVPSSIITVSVPSSDVATSSAPYDTVPYPEWRVNTVENARKAGMGDVGKPMAWVLCADKGPADTLLAGVRRPREASLQETQYKTSTIAAVTHGYDVESDDSEMEWDGWMRDLRRQSGVRERPDKVSGGQGHTAPNVPPLPSPPPSEASPSGSPRVRSFSLPRSQLVANPYAQYPNIGNVIQAGGTCDNCSMELPRPSERMITTTVSVGTAPSPRRRSSTMSARPTPPTRRDHDREPIPKISGGASRATGAMQGSQRSTSVRHAHSSSNLRTPTSPYISDAVESPPGRAGPSTPPKRQSAFMRGMTQRAGKIVRGLESAIDFVDEKSV